MSDDLVKRLRLIGEKRLQCTACYKFIETADEAADRIEKLEQERDNAKYLLQQYFQLSREASDESDARIEHLEAALAKIAQHDMQAIAMDALRPGERIRNALDAE